MSSLIIEAIADSILSDAHLLNDTVEILWHAGEPMTLQPAWYHSAINVFSNRSRSRIIQIFQTNATLITDSWCQYLKDTGSLLGVSIDGPKHLTDRIRTKRNGGGSFSSTMTGIGLLQKNDIPFHVLCVLSEHNIGHPLELFQFFEDLGARALRFLPEDAVGTNHSTSIGSPRYVTLIRDFYLKYSQLILEKASRQEIPDFDLVLRRLIDPSATQPIQETAETGIILSVDYMGDVYALSPEFMSTPQSRRESFRVGNVQRNSLADIQNSQKYRSLIAQVQDGIEVCKKDCGYFRFCGGGDPASKYFEHGRLDVGATLACELRLKTMVDGLKCITLERK